MGNCKVKVIRNPLVVLHSDKTVHMSQPLAICDTAVPSHRSAVKYALLGPLFCAPTKKDRSALKNIVRRASASLPVDPGSTLFQAKPFET